jgi:SnoaL-like protein
MKIGPGAAASLLAVAAPVLAQSAEGMFAQGQVAAALDGFHAAAAAADEEKYFSYFAADAVFLGTDATERWTRDEFRKWAHPYFARGKAWTYTPKSRWIAFSPDRRMAWFDELLDNASLGTCRGSGVLVLTSDGWKIEQYNLAIMVPNDASDAVVKTIRDAAGRPPAKK